MGIPMHRSKLVFFLVLFTAFLCNTAQGSGKLHGPIRITSSVLGYDLQYWVYLPEKVRKPLPELYITDGQVYLGSGEMVKILDSEIEKGNIAPIAAIFVDSRNPDDYEEARRNNEFMCRVNYAKFFLGELMPEVSANWTGADASAHRGLMGVSFGAINTACFGMMMQGVFQVLIMQSPASDKHVEVINNLYQEKPPHSSAIFISHGGPEDNSVAGSQFAQTLKEKGYPVRYVTNDGGHDWDNWRPLIDDSLRGFAGLRAEDEITVEDPETEAVEAETVDE
jgi:enterochelin esterase-like enzyme